jgi:hypothetical protein
MVSNPKAEELRWKESSTVGALMASLQYAEDAPNHSGLLAAEVHSLGS